MDRTELDRQLNEIFAELKKKLDALDEKYYRKGVLDGGGGKERKRLICEAVEKKDKLIKEFNEKHS